jgi:hypothetical protein
MILSRVTVGLLTSNGRPASSTSDFLAPVIQTTACSCLPWPTVLPRRPHRPLLLPSLSRPSLYSPTPPVILRRWQPHTAAKSQPSYYPPHVLMLCVVPCLTIVHRLGAVHAAWSTWSTKDSHQKRTVRGEADKLTHQLHLRTQGSASLLSEK